MLSAPPQPLLEAGARHERTLEAVGCRRLILIQASSAAQCSGKVAIPKTHPQGGDLDELLYAATYLLLRHRSTRQGDVRLYSRSKRHEAGAQESADDPRSVFARHCSLSGGFSCRCRVYLHVVLARRPLSAGRDCLCAWACPLYESDSWRQSQER